MTYEEKLALVTKWGWPYEKWRAFIEKFVISTKTSWEGDYREYVNSITSTEYVAPVRWGRFFYGDNWNKEEDKKMMTALAEMAGNKDSVMLKKHEEKLTVKELAEALYEGTPHLQNLAEKLARQHSGAGALCFYSKQYPEVKKFYEHIATQLIEHAKEWKPHQEGACELNQKELDRLKKM